MIRGRKDIRASRDLPTPDGDDEGVDVEPFLDSWLQVEIDVPPSGIGHKTLHQMQVTAMAVDFEVQRGSTTTRRTGGRSTLTTMTDPVKPTEAPNPEFPPSVYLVTTIKTEEYFITIVGATKSS